MDNYPYRICLAMKVVNLVIQIRSMSFLVLVKGMFKYLPSACTVHHSRELPIFERVAGIFSVDNFSQPSTVHI